MSRCAAGGAALSDEAVFQLAATLEGHPDNVAACLAGGLTIAWRPRPRTPAAGVAPGPRLLRIAVPTTLRAVLCVPSVPLSTEAARQALPAAVPHADAAANAARSALLVAALTGAPQVLFEATEDFLHQPYRAGLMPETAALLGALRRAGAAAVVSGAGPAVLVLSFDGQPPSPGAVGSIAGKTGTPWACHPPAYRSAGCSRTARRAGRASISQRAARAYLEPGAVPEQVQGPGADHTGVPRRDRASFLHDTQTASRGNVVGSLGVKLNAAPGAPLRGQVLACHLLRRRPHGRPQPVILRQHPGSPSPRRVRQPRRRRGEPGNERRSGQPPRPPGTVSALLPRPQTPG